MQPTVSIIMPAWNEGARIKMTLSTLKSLNEQEGFINQIIVIDDGSTDDTYQQAERYADRVIRHERNYGKGAALETGLRETTEDILVFLDADLGQSAAHVLSLLIPVMQDRADMTIAKLPPALRKGGFGLVKGLAVRGIYRLCGFRSEAPLSGQRAIKRTLLQQIGGLSQGFGIEVGLTIDAARRGFRILEVEVPFRHHETGRNWSGFIHRGKQFCAVGRTLLGKWRNPV